MKTSTMTRMVFTNHRTNTHRTLRRHCTAGYQDRHTNIYNAKMLLSGNISGKGELDVEFSVKTFTTDGTDLHSPGGIYLPKRSKRKSVFSIVKSLLEKDHLLFN